MFDGVSTALIRASEATGEVNEMLHRLADSTRQNVAAFEEALSSQINARSSITWGTYGPWMIFAAFKIATLFFAAALGAANLFGSANAYFSSFQGNLVALGAAGITIFTNRYCNSLSQRGLVVQRLATTEAQSSGPVISRGQSQAQQPTLSPRGSMLSAQHNQAGAN